MLEKAEQTDGNDADNECVDALREKPLNNAARLLRVKCRTFGYARMHGSLVC
ncbi:hypothetical protein WN51_02088 [Melipona quadrifasciata]|uniref:Uncharacterized protein n=1 Tax=Melipona quadrifasciata TaxID=166423 RepID=A0A0M8ZZ72_9HYME|nr:hypothetical protein WN51_02088 [Melipona quadrifasciata]